MSERDNEVHGTWEAEPCALCGQVEAIYVRDIEAREKLRLIKALFDRTDAAAVAHRAHARHRGYPQ